VGFLPLDTPSGRRHLASFRSVCAVAGHVSISRIDVGAARELATSGKADELPCGQHIVQSLKKIAASYKSIADAGFRLYPFNLLGGKLMLCPSPALDRALTLPLPITLRKGQNVTAKFAALRPSHRP
jgi:hypothetical protein